LCHVTISASIMAANMWKNSLKNVESDNNKILYETLLNFFLRRNGIYFLNKLRNFLSCGLLFIRIPASVMADYCRTHIHQISNLLKYEITFFPNLSNEKCYVCKYLPESRRLWRLVISHMGKYSIYPPPHVHWFTSLLFWC
jgi:hypothetical protein